LKKSGNFAGLRERAGDHGRLAQKPSPTWAHAILQQLIAELIRQAGYVTGVTISGETIWQEFERRMNP
jgi:hypothetical protein